MKTRTISFSIATITAGFFFFIMLQPNPFNYIPYLFYKSFFEQVNSDGEIISSVNEQTVILVFNLMIAGLIFWIVLKICTTLLLRGKN